MVRLVLPAQLVLLLLHLDPLVLLALRVRLVLHRMSRVLLVLPGRRERLVLV